MRAINKHLHQVSLLENIKEGNSSYEADPQFATMNRHLETINSDKNLDNRRHMQDHREQEMKIMLNEEQKRKNEIEELMNIEEKLERNYKYYEKVK
jgi:ribosomal protein S8